MSRALPTPAVTSAPATQRTIVLVETRTPAHRPRAARRVLLAFPFLAVAVPDRPRLARSSCCGRRAVADAADGLCRADLAGPCGAPGGRCLYGRNPVREANAPFWITLPAAAVVGALLGVVFRLPSLRLRGLYLAVSTLALHFVVVYIGGEYETRRGFSTGVVDRSAEDRRLELGSGRVWYFILLIAAAATLLVCLNLLRSRTGRAWRPSGRRRRSPKRSASDRALQAARVRYQLRDDVARRRAVRLLSRFCLGRGVFAVSVDPICRDDHHRRHGIAARRAARCRVRDSVPYLIEALLALPKAQSYAGRCSRSTMPPSAW